MLLSRIHSRPVVHTPGVRALAPPLHVTTQASHSSIDSETVPHRSAGHYPKPTVSIHNDDPQATESELVFDRAAKDLAQFCTAEADADCWNALGWYSDKRHELEESCEVELDKDGHSGNACEGVNSLEKLTRELMSTGSVRELAHTLEILQRAEKRKQAQMAQQNPAMASTAASTPMSERIEAERLRCRQLFRKLDANGDGHISVTEFQHGLEAIGAVLTDYDIEQISNALEHQWKMDMDEFMDIMEASRAAVGFQEDGNFLRHVSHGYGSHHEKYHP